MFEIMQRSRAAPAVDQATECDVGANMQGDHDVDHQGCQGQGQDNEWCGQKSESSDWQQWSEWPTANVHYGGGMAAAASILLLSANVCYLICFAVFAQS